MDYLNLLKELEKNEVEIFAFHELKNEYGLSEDQLQNSLDTLVKYGLLSRIEKGKYCRHNFRNEYVISNYLTGDGVVAYWSALNLHGLTEQFPNTVFVQTSKQKKHKEVFGVRYQFIKVKPEKMVGIVWEGYGNHQYRMTDLEKTIVDCFDLPQYAGGLAELIRAFAGATLNAEKMVRYCKAVQHIAATKRMAYLVEIFNKPEMSIFLEYAQSIVNEKYNLFDAFGNDDGHFVKKWKLRMNMSEQDILYLANKQY